MGCDAWQKAFGYLDAYNRAAPYLSMVFDSYPIYFDYEGRTWLVQIWKGQYGICTGCEIGLYYTDGIVKNAKDADLFICEGMYGEDDKLEKAKGYKHMTFREAATLAKQADVGEMWLTHYSPSLIRPDEYMDMVRDIFPKAYPGKDGKTVEMNFEED